jgi:N utilization substance protein A
VRQVVNELKGEKVDIVEWDDDSARFIAEALSPARVQQVRFDDEGEEEGTAVVIVPDHQLSLAIGREGQNARLAARLSGFRIDIRSESQDLGLDVDEEEEAVEFETVEEGDGAQQLSTDSSEEQSADSSQPLDEEQSAVSSQQSEEEEEEAEAEAEVPEADEEPSDDGEEKPEDEGEPESEESGESNEDSEDSEDGS